ncbi:hypothetical protein BZA77DRAFT_300766 [Pyronema omphalodes]|nr:hypothetical protein BZA77DRAFT_300766 [Pyronema omphalodes]
MGLWDYGIGIGLGNILGVTYVLWIPYFGAIVFFFCVSAGWWVCLGLVWVGLGWFRLV